MKLAAKLVLVIVLGIAVVLVIDGYISLNRQRDLFAKDTQHGMHILGLAMKRLVSDTWRMAGPKQAWNVIADVNEEEPTIDIRWVWLDAPPGDPNAPRVSRDEFDPATQNEEISFTQRDQNKAGYFYSYFPIAVDDGRPGAIEIRESRSELERRARRALNRIVVLTASLVLLSAYAAMLLGVRLIGRPLDQVVQKIRRAGTGDFSTPLQLSGHGELNELAAGLNTMCEQLDEAWTRVRNETEARIAVLEQLRHEDRLKTVGRLTSGIAHELGTPLNVISGYAAMIAGGTLPSQDTTQIAQTIKTQSDRIAHIIRQLLDFARRRPGQKITADPGQLVHQTVDMMVPLTQKQNVNLILTDTAAQVAVKADTEQIKQVLLNLITNAVQAMPQGGEVQITVGPAETGPPVGHADPHAEYVCISIADEGEGIPEENLSRIFEPFFTTKGPGKGTGLGLSIAEGIVREHGGWIAVQSTVGKGSRFCVYLPKEGETCRDES